ncbi:MAG: hypothetical protein ACI94Y_003265 [Maribacter sp.]
MSSVLSYFSIVMIISFQSPPNSEEYTFLDNANGCSSFFVYKTNGATVGLSVSGQRDELSLTTSPQTFGIATNQNIQAVLTEFSNGILPDYYCSDIALIDTDPYTFFTAISGDVTAQILEDNIVVNPWGIEYRVKVSIENGVFEDENGNQRTIDNETYEDVYVGWFPG